MTLGAPALIVPFSPINGRWKIHADGLDADRWIDFIKHHSSGWCVPAGKAYLGKELRRARMLEVNKTWFLVWGPTGPHSRDIHFRSTLESNWIFSRLTHDAIWCLKKIPSIKYLLVFLLFIRNISKQDGWLEFLTSFVRETKIFLSFRLPGKKLHHWFLIDVVSVFGRDE